ncbi:MAG: FAD-dependent oxidoreductase [Bacteroidales bacterium]|nr:FAD-dependent oxidoreductase [Bacteroidales bacterium]
MEHYKYIILGAGPSGLSLANKLLQKGETSFLLIEKEKTTGGLCRSEIIDGLPLDIGGGHFLDVKNKDVLDFVFSFMNKNEWNIYNRISHIIYKGKEIDYPFEANIWQMDIEDQVEFLESIATAGSNKGISKPELFEEWITWKLGKKIAKEYMLPYNKKIWSYDLNKLGTYWLYKLPNVSFKDTLLSVIKKTHVGSIPAHAQFYYPKKQGYGEVWKRMGEKLGKKLILNSPVEMVETDNLIVNGKYHAEYVINTIPWTQWVSFNDVPYKIKTNINKLEYASIQVDYYPKNINSKAHWIYDPDINKSYHRILCRHNFLENSNGYWTETNLKRSNKCSEFHFINKFAYPLNTINKPIIIKNILEWAERKNIFGLGRWGMWEHMNSDITVNNSLKFADKLSKL